MIYKNFNEWADGQWLEDGEPRKQAYTRDELLLIEMGWNYGFDAARLAHPETSYQVGQRLQRTGYGISDIPTAVPHDDDIAEALRGYEDAAQPEPPCKTGSQCIGGKCTQCMAEPEPDKYLMEVECTKCGAKQDGILTVTAPPQRVYCSCGDGIVPDDGALCGTCVSLKDAVKQEPVAFQCCEHGDNEWFITPAEAYGLNPNRYKYRQLYTAPQQREWEGLTDEERNELFFKSIDNEWTDPFLMKQVEAKLREKNTSLGNNKKLEKNA